MPYYILSEWKLQNCCAFETAKANFQKEKMRYVFSSAVILFRGFSDDPFDQPLEKKEH